MRLIIKNLKHWRVKRDALTLGILSFVVVILWIAIEVYQTYVQTTVTGDVQDQLEPLSPSIDNQALDGLKNRFSPPGSFSVIKESPDIELINLEETKVSTASSPQASPSGTPQ